MSIEFHLANNQVNFEPGDTIRGEVHWDLPREQTLKPDDALILELIFETHGHGTTQREAFSTQQWLHCKPNGYRTFQLPSPDWPWSFSGKLISLVWLVNASFGEYEANLPIVLSPGGEAVDLTKFHIEPLSEKWELRKRRLETRFPFIRQFTKK